MPQKSRKNSSIKSKKESKIEDVVPNVIAQSNNNYNATTLARLDDSVSISYIANRPRNSKRKKQKGVVEKLPYYQKVILNYSGFILALCSTVYLTSSYYMIKLSKCLNASDMGTIKFTITTICCFIIATCSKQNVLGPKGSRFLLLGRGLAGSIALILIFFSIQMINYGDATVIRNTSPIITALCARIFMKELLNISHFISFIISMAGVIIVARPPFIFGSLLKSTTIEINSTYILGVSLAIISTLAIGTAFVFIKKLATKEVHFSVTIFYLSFIGCILCALTSVALFFIGLSHKKWDLEKSFLYRDIGLAIIAGFVNFLGHICFTLALVHENANTISIMRILDIVMAFLLDYLVLEIIPDLFSFIGASLVIISIVVIFVYKIIIVKLINKEKKIEEKTTFRI